jgi:hypothetical protein
MEGDHRPRGRDSHRPSDDINVDLIHAVFIRILHAVWVNPGATLNRSDGGRRVAGRIEFHQDVVGTLGMDTRDASVT